MTVLIVAIVIFAILFTWASIASEQIRVEQDELIINWALFEMKRRAEDHKKRRMISKRRGRKK